jgi:hypothetical protein
MKRELQLNQSQKSLGASVQSFELGSQVLKIEREGYEIGH